MIEEHLRQIVREEVVRVLEPHIKTLRDAADVLRGNRRSGEWLTVRKAAEHAHCTPATVRKWIARGELQRHEVCGRLRVSQAELDAMLAGQRNTDVSDADIDSITDEIARRAATRRRSE